MCMVSVDLRIIVRVIRDAWLSAIRQTSSSQSLRSSMLHAHTAAKNPDFSKFNMAALMARDPRQNQKIEHFSTSFFKYRQVSGRISLNT